MTEPGFIDRTMAASTRRGAGRPGICAVVMTRSWETRCFATASVTRRC
jgi:hypothetical protein